MPDDVVTPEWLGSIEDETQRNALAGFESQEKLFETIGYTIPEPEKAPDWREGIKDEEGKKFADDSTDVDHLARRAVDMRNKMSGAIFKPGKDATDEQITAFSKAMGVPKNAEGYEFPALAEGQELTDDMKTSQAEWGTRFHGLNVPKEAAKALAQFLAEDVAKAHLAEVEAFKAHAASEDEKLHDLWKGKDYDENTAVGNRALNSVAELSEVNVDDVTSIKTLDGRMLLDNANFMRMFATIGREMSEGGLGPTLSDTEIETANEAIEALQKKIDEAQGAGKTKLANELYQTKLALIAKRDGDKPIVGSEARAA